MAAQAFGGAPLPAPGAEQSAAAGAYYTADQTVQRVLQLLAQGQIPQAAQLYSSFQEDLGFAVMNRAKVNRELLKRVANLFAAARDYEKAALCCEELEEFAAAAQLYERCADYTLAAEMYSKVGDFKKAADMFMKNQEYHKAAEHYRHIKDDLGTAQALEKLGAIAEAGKIYFGLKKYQQAMALLQQVKPADKDYLAASRMIAEILARSGSVELGIRKLEGVLRGAALDAGSIELYYLLAVLHRQQGNFARAKDLFGEVVGIDFNFRDAQKRLKEVEDRVASGAVPPAPAPAPAAAPPAAEPHHATPGEHQAAAGVVSMLEGFEHVQTMPLLSELSLGELKAFYNSCEKHEFNPGDVVIEQNTPGAALHLLTSGEFEVLKVQPDGTTRPLAKLAPGSYVGEMALIDDAPTSARVVAVRPAVTLAISREAFQGLLDSSDACAHKILRVFVHTLSQRLRETSAKLAGR